MRIETYVFVDLESTGLPSLSNTKIRMAEISCIAMSRNALKFITNGNCKPRVLQKLTVVVNPRKFITDEVEELTGLSNFNLEEESPFNTEKANLVTNFFATLKKPVCLVAHNGNKFDFPLLKEEFKKFENIVDEDLLCADSLPAFKEIQRSKTSEELTDDSDELLNQICQKVEEQISEVSSNDWRAHSRMMQELNEVTPQSQLITNSGSYFSAGTTPPSHLVKNTMSNNVGTVKRKLFDGNFPSTSKVPRLGYRLKDIYFRYFGEEKKDQHSAESDAEALMQCIVKEGEKVLEFFDKNCKLFKEVKSLY